MISLRKVHTKRKLRAFKQEGGQNQKSQNPHFAVLATLLHKNEHPPSQKCSKQGKCCNQRLIMELLNISILWIFHLQQHRQDIPSADCVFFLVAMHSTHFAENRGRSWMLALCSGLCTSRPNWSHTCSLGLMSGEHAGHGMVGTRLLLQKLRGDATTGVQNVVDPIIKR